MELRDQIRVASTDRGITLAELVLGAIERTQHHLSDLVANERPAASQASGGLFPDTPRSARRSTEARVTISIRLSAANLAVLDQLVVQHHADNRSQLITAALRGDLAH
ncbi:ribbon-helix-helix domain-containing protein [Nocardioides pacificus]